MLNWMKDVVQKRFYPNLDSMKKALINVWTQLITPEYCEKLARSMPRRIAAVQRAGGYQTKY